MARKRSNGKKRQKRPLRVFGGDCSKHTCSWIENSVYVDNMDECDIVVMPGGADWSPVWYNEQASKLTHCYAKSDIKQMKIILEAIQRDKLIVGICRGLQGIHIAAGGHLIQHVTNHGGDRHDIVDVYSGEIFRVNSLHHQMVNLKTLHPDDYVLLAHAPSPLSASYLNGHDLEWYDEKTLIYYKNDDSFVEPEAVYYPKINAIGFQYHPEMMSTNTSPLEYTNRLIKEVLLLRETEQLNGDYDSYKLVLELEDKIESMESILTGNANVKPPRLPATTTAQQTCTCTTTTQYEKKNWNSMLEEW